METAQEGRCAICRRTPTEAELGEDHLHIDHCHAEGPHAVRGLLCRGCNYAIGHAADDPERLRAMADYLERFARA